MDEWTTQQRAQLKAALDRRYKELLAMVREELRSTEQPTWLALADRITDIGIESVADVLTEARAVSVDHHVRELTERLTEIQHDHGEVIIASMHVHLDHHHCLEVIAARGPAREIKAMADRLIGARGVLTGHVVPAALAATSRRKGSHGHG